MTAGWSSIMARRLRTSRSARPGLPRIWVDVQGLANLELIRGLGERYGLHPLTIADVVNAHQRPKLESHDDHLFIVAAAAGSDRGAGHRAALDPAWPGLRAHLPGAPGRLLRPGAGTPAAPREPDARPWRRLPGLCADRRPGRQLLPAPGKLRRADRGAGGAGTRGPSRRGSSRSNGCGASSWRSGARSGRSARS